MFRIKKKKNVREKERKFRHRKIVEWNLKYVRDDYYSEYLSKKMRK